MTFILLASPLDGFLNQAPYQETMETFERAKQAVAGASPLAAWGSIVIALCVIGFLLFLYFRPANMEARVPGPYILLGAGNPQAAEPTVTVFEQEQINRSFSNNFTLSFFVYMDDVNTERIPIAGPKGDFRFKPLVYILGVGDVLLDPIHQIARVRIKPLNKEAKPDAVTSIDVEQFMIARWNQLTVTVEGRTVDVYLNGVLANSALLENVPALVPQGVLLETSPDFSGQAGLFQAWPFRQPDRAVAANYARTTDKRGKPLIRIRNNIFSDALKSIRDSFCSLGLCDSTDTGPLTYIEYEFA